MNSVFQAGQTLLHSEKTLWRGLTIREKLLPPMQTGAQLVADHMLMLTVGQAGVGEWRTDSDQWHWKTYPTGSVSLLPQGSTNDARWDKEARVIYLSLAPDLLTSIFDTDQIRLPAMRAIPDSMIQHIVLSLHRELNLQDYAGQLLGESLALTLATHLITAYAVGRPKVYAPQGKLSATQLRHLIDYALSHLDQRVGVAEWAQVAQLSLFHFARLFKNTLGLSPHQYLLALKVEKAKQLIKQNRHSFTEIAYLLGFADQAHFTNAFKKVAGLSPSGFFNH